MIVNRATVSKDTSANFKSRRAVIDFIVRCCRCCIGMAVITVFGYLKRCPLCTYLYDWKKVAIVAAAICYLSPAVLVAASCN